MSVFDGSKNVGAAGVREALAAARIPAHWVIVQAKSTNGGLVFVGGPTVSSASGPEFASGESMFFPPVGNTYAYDLHDIYVDAAVNGEGVKYVYDK